MTTTWPPPSGDRRLVDLSREARTCRACDLWKTGTQTVFGTGRASAPIMLVGEQPGDREDRTGLPFVGPAGRVLEAALAEAGIAPDQVYVTNAVKHFKWTPRGTRRIHAKPNERELAACRPWLRAEIAAVRPDLVVCLGATATRSVTGERTPLVRLRGRVIGGADHPPAIATYHPSSILRLTGADADARRADLIADLVSARRLLAA